MGFFMACSKRWLIAVSSFSILLIFGLIGQNSSAHAQADIALTTLHDSQDPISGKNDFSYNLRLFNYGDQPAKKTRVTLPIPQGLTFISVSPEQQCKLDKANNQVECDFGTLQADASKSTDIRVTVRHEEFVATSYTLTATAQTSSMELITNNNGQSETTTFSNGTARGPDIGITRLEEVTKPNKKNERSFDLIIKNFANQKAVDAKLVVMIPSLLEFDGAHPARGCKFEANLGRLSCNLDELEPISKGGEDVALRLSLLDRSQTLGAVQLKALLIASGDDVDIRNDLHKLTVTLGVKAIEAKPFEPASVARVDQKDMVPEVTAAIESTPQAEPVSPPQAQPAPSPQASTSASSGGDTGSGGSTDAASSGGSTANKGSSFFDNFVNLFGGVVALKQNAGPSGGDVDFQIQSFETNPDVFPAGSTFTLNTELINNGPGTANNATLDINLPLGVAFVSGPAGCVHDGNPPTGASQVNCSFGNLANAVNVSVPIILRATVPGRVVKSLSAVIDSSSVETNPTNTTQEITATISNGADLLLDIVGTPNPAVAGSNVTYGLTVTNQGLNIAEGASVIFNLPPGISFVSSGSGGSGWSCSAAGQVVTCASGANIAATSGTVSFSVVGQIGVGGGTYTASGAVYSAVTPDVEGSNDTTTFDLIVEPGTDLSVSKSVSQNPMFGGSTPSFTITVTNNGPVVAQNLVLTDTLPVNFTYVPAGSGGAGWSCSNAGQLVTCTRPTMAVGASDVTINVVAPANNLIPEAGATVVNSASISTDTNDAVVGNNTGEVSFALQRDGADLQIQFVASPDPVAQGAALARDIRVKNLGPRTATGNYRITYQLTAGETITSALGLGWSCLPAAGVPLKLTCEHAGPLGVGVTSSTLRVASQANDAGAVVNETCTSSQTGLEPIEGDPAASNNCVTRTGVSTAQIADIVVTKTVSPSVLTSNNNRLTYQVVVRNDGPDDATSVLMTDRIPGYVDAYGPRPATAITATFGATACDVGRFQINCRLGTIANGDRKVIDITVDRPLVDGAFVNLAQAYSSTIGDPDRANNRATVNVSIEPATDLQLRSAVWTPDPVKAGVEATYVLTMRNNGPSVADGVTLKSIFIGDFTFISAIPSQGTCAPFNVGTGTLDCSIGNMAFTNQQTVTVKLRPNHQAAPPVTWEVTNTTTIATTTQESDYANNAGGANLGVVGAEIDLDVAQTDLVDPIAYNPGVPADNLITYQVIVNNFGPSYATGVNFDDKFTTPVGSHALKFICDKASSAGACVEATPGQHCTGQGTIANNGLQASINCIVKKGAADQGEMAAGSTYTRYLMYEVLNTPVAGGETHQKEVVVTANEFDPNEASTPTNNKAVAQTTVRIRTDVAVACAAPSISGTPVVGPVNLRQPFDLKLTVDNNGPGDSQVTTLTQNLPSGMVLTGPPIPDVGVCSGVAGGTSFTCDLGVVGTPGTTVVTVPVRAVSFPSGGTYSNVGANVASNEIDTNAANDNCAINVNVARSSIAGFVYEDHSDDGVKDGGETPLQGVVIRLTGTDAYGNAVNTTETTDGSGAYKFWNRSPSDGAGYTLTETHPANYQDGLENAGGSSVVGGSRTTDLISSVALGTGEDKVNYNFGELPADLEVVSKTPAAPSASLREPFDYTIVVRNNGPAIAVAATLADNLPANMELTAQPTSTTGTCTGASGAGSFTCSFGDMAKNASLTVTALVMITVTGNYSNTATASTDTTEITLTNNAKSGGVGVTGSSIACAVYRDLNDNGIKEGGEPVFAGVPVTLTGTDAYGNTVSLSQNTLGDGSCLFANLSPSNGAGYTLTETVQPAGFGDGKENRGGASVIANSKTSDQIDAIVLGANENLANNWFGELPVDLEVTSKTPTLATVSLLEPFDFTIVMTNNGPGDATTSVLTDNLPVGMELTTTPTSTLGICTGNAGDTAISCNLGTVANGLVVTITVPVKVTVLPGSGSYTNSASITTDKTETTLANNASSGSVSIIKSRISCVVYQDLNDNGNKNIGEPGIAGVAMSLVGTDDYGNAVNLTQNTAGDGSCSFDNLAPSTIAIGGGYTLSETVQPAGFNDGQENNEGTIIPGSGNGNDVIGPIDLAANTDLQTHQFGEVPPSGLSGTVWCDDNNNGTIDGGENTLIGGVTITLSGTDADGPVNATKITDGNGYYLFANLSPGTYTLTQTQLTSHACKLPGKASPGTGATTAAGAADNANASASFGNVISGIQLAANDVAVSYNFGELEPANIAGHVYLDADGSGDRQGTESGIVGVAIALSCTGYRDNAYTANTSTIADGSYSFNNILPTNAAGCSITQTHPLSYVDGGESVGTLGGTVGADVFTTIPVASGNNGIGYDFGERQTGLSGVVYYDPNNNGLVEGGETRLAGVTITLTGTDAAGNAVSRTTTTNGTGDYVFTALAPSDPRGYTVTQTQPATYLQGKASVGTGAATVGTADNTGANATYGNIIAGIVVTDAASAINYNFGELRPASIAGLVFNDISRDGTRDIGEPGIEAVEITLTCTDHRGRAVSLTTPTLADGTYLFDNLEPSDGSGCTLAETQPTIYLDGVDVAGTLGGTVANDNISAIPLLSEDAGTGYDFAELSAGLSGHVYVDSNNDGVLDSGERLLAGVTIELSGLDASGGNVLVTTTTDANGYYIFTGLSPSDAAGYRVAETTQPAAWADGKDTAGSVGGTVGNDEVTGIVLTATDFATDYNFGEVGGALSGVVYTDLNNDGQQTGTESGIPGATLTLSCVDVNAQAFSATTTTGGDGSYRFADIPATDAAGCAISETQPPNTSDGLDRVGTLGGTLGNDVLSAIPVAPGDEGFGYNFGEILTNPARISGTIWHDSNHDRLDNDGNPRTGWTVELINRDIASDCQAGHRIVASQTTNGAGDYAFEGVSPGTYGIQFRSPTGGYLYAGAQSGHTTGAAIACGIGSIVVIAGDDIIDQDLPVDPSGVVYDSLTRIPVSGATVTISGPVGFNPSNHLVGGISNVSQTTGTDGYYQFLLYVGAPAGDYSLSVGQPTGYVPQDSAIIPVCTNTLSVGQSLTPALVQSSDTAPTLAASTHIPANCPTSSAGLAAGAGSTQYYFTFNLRPALPSANVVNNHIPLDPVTAGAFTVTKTTPKVNVSIGQLVPYTITARNNIAATLPNMELEDQIPPGFKYKRGSASLDGVRTEPVINGRRLTWPALTFTANQVRSIKLLMIVGSGVSEGDYINKAWAENGFVQALASNIATAKVRVTPDPTFDCAGVIGKVFDDKNRNGYQDKGELGLANVRLATVRGLLVTTDKYGRYHVACADVPNPDRGSNFIMKLDPRTLPSGYRLTTENPRIIRLTRGKIGKLNFGVAIHRVVRLDVTRDAFTARGNRLKRTWENGIKRLVGILDKGPSILRIAYARSHIESGAEVRARISIIKKHVTRLWKRKRRRVLVIETESHLLAQGSFKGGSFKK